MKAAAAALLLVTAGAPLGGCHSDSARAPLATTIERCDYRLELTASGLVRVDAHCQARGELLFRADPGHTRDVLGPAPSASGRFRADGGRLRYTVDVARIARRDDDIDSAVEVGASFVAPLSSVLLVPEPLTTEIPVAVQVAAAPGVQVSVGLARGALPDSYRLMAHEISVATYFAFGKLQQRTLDVRGSKLELSWLDGALDQSVADVSAWVDASAKAVSDFYGSFPVPRASLTLIPVERRHKVVFGKLLPESEPGIALLLGQHASRRELYSDWKLVHELFHLGVPSFNGEGKWLDEGLATYYEPIIRVRAGLYTEIEMWDELEKALPRGMPAFTQHGLEQANDFRGVYWGGALACLAADVQARQRRLDVGLEVGVRALRDAGGTASEVWSLADAIAAVDGALGQPTLAPIAARHAKRGSPFELRHLLGELGVTRGGNGRITLSDSAPLAAVRRAITKQP